MPIQYIIDIILQQGKFAKWDLADLGDVAIQSQDNNADSIVPVWTKDLNKGICTFLFYKLWKEKDYSTMFREDIWNACFSFWFLQLAGSSNFAMEKNDMYFCSAWWELHILIVILHGIKCFLLSNWGKLFISGFCILYIMGSRSTFSLWCNSNLSNEQNLLLQKLQWPQIALFAQGCKSFHTQQSKPHFFENFYLKFYGATASTIYIGLLFGLSGTVAVISNALAGWKPAYFR